MYHPKWYHLPAEKGFLFHSTGADVFIERWERWSWKKGSFLIEDFREVGEVWSIHCALIMGNPIHPKWKLVVVVAFNNCFHPKQPWDLFEVGVVVVIVVVTVFVHWSVPLQLFLPRLLRLHSFSGYLENDWTKSHVGHDGERWCFGRKTFCKQVRSRVASSKQLKNWWFNLGLSKK